MICQANDITNYRLVDFAAIVDGEQMYHSKAKPRQASYFLVKQFDGLQLTQRQSECLYLLLHGNTGKQIAARLCLSVRTVETYIDQLKRQFQCYSKSQLIEKSLSLGLLQYIPESLL